MLWIALAGGVGAVSRFIADGLIRTIVGRELPWATIIINVSGSFILGLLTGLTLQQASPDIYMIWGIGFCGGYTTFSTASFEVVRLIEDRRIFDAFTYIAASLFFTISFYGLGFLVTSLR